MMSVVRRSLAAAASAAVVTLLVTGGNPLGAQEGGSARSQVTKGKQAAKVEPQSSADSNGKTKGTGKVAPPDPTHRVPPGYARLGLTDQQKDRIYKIQADYYPKVQGLQKQLDSLRAEREAKFEAVLTTSQKQMLAQEEQQKKAAAAARKATGKTAAKQKSSN
jgi:hypothetical protein